MERIQKQASQLVAFGRVCGTAVPIAVGDKHAGQAKEVKVNGE